MLKLCVIAVVVGVATAKSDFPISKTCTDEKDEAKQCFKNTLAEAGVKFEMKDVRECLKQCPGRGGKGDGEEGGKGRGDKGAHASFKEVHKCLKEEIGEEIEQCINEKVDFELVEHEGVGNGFGGKGHRSGKGHGRGKGRQGGRKRGFFQRAACSEEVEQCVRGVVGDWFDRQDELKRVLCNAGGKCWTGPSNECETQRRELKNVMCVCKEEYKAEVESALDKCTVDLSAFARRRLSKKVDKFCDESSDDESSGASHQRGPHHRFCDDSASAEDENDDAE